MIAASALHAAAMAMLHEACFDAAAWSAASIDTLFANPAVFGFITEAGGLVIARAVADEAEILTIGVVPVARRHGLGHQLLNAALTEARRRRAETIFLEVAADNAAARALYVSAGFTEAGRRRHYYGPGQDAVLLRRRLCE